MPEEIVAHTGEPDVEDGAGGHHAPPRRDGDRFGGYGGRRGPSTHFTLVAAIEIVSAPTPTTTGSRKMRDYPLIGIPVYAVFDPRTEPAPSSPTSTPPPTAPATRPARTSCTERTSPSAEWTISTENLPRYKA